MLRASFAVLAALILFAPAASAVISVNNVSDLIVFGDSLVDAGNVFAATGGTTPDPAAGYVSGRFTNGLTFTDIINAAIEGSAMVPSLGGGDNYGWGGAKAATDADGIPDLTAQIAAYSAVVGGVADPTAQYLINAGGNDMFAALPSLPNAGPFIDAATDAILDSVMALQALGATAKNILVVGIPDIGAAPATPAGAKGLARGITQVVNFNVQSGLPAGVEFFDTVALFDSVLADPTAFGLPAGLITATSCLGDNPPPPAPGSLCDDYAFFDDVHPTAQVLGVLGTALIPEPGTGLLLAMGLVGLAVRRRAA